MRKSTGLIWLNVLRFNVKIGTNQLPSAIPYTVQGCCNIIMSAIETLFDQPTQCSLTDIKCKIVLADLGRVIYGEFRADGGGRLKAEGNYKTTFNMIEYGTLF